MGCGGTGRRRWRWERRNLKRTELASLSGGIVTAGERALVGLFAAVGALV
jgi:hypothetical protein